MDTKLDKCDCDVIHIDRIETAKKELEKSRDFFDLADFFKAFGDNTRLKILKILLSSDMCVCDIVYLLEMTQPAISHHLKILKNMRLIKSRREGKFVYYSLDDKHIVQILNSGFEHFSEYQFNK